MANEISAGTRVHVLNADQSADLGLGTYQGEVELTVEGKTIPGLNTPKIKLDSGEEILGCECWWHPV